MNASLFLSFLPPAEVSKLQLAYWKHVRIELKNARLPKAPEVWLTDRLTANALKNKKIIPAKRMLEIKEQFASIMRSETYARN